MALDLDEVRAEFAAFLAADSIRFSMDRALAHVVTLAYRKGLQDGAVESTSLPPSSTGVEAWAKALGGSEIDLTPWHQEVRESAD